MKENIKGFWFIAPEGMMSVILFPLGGSTPDMGEGERAGRSPDLVNRD